MRRLILIFLCLVCLNAHAFVFPVSKVQNTMSGVVQGKMQSRGIAANDPRYVGTLTQIGGAIAGAAASALLVSAAGVTAPAWITAAAAAGVGAVVSAEVTLAANGVVHWLFDSDGNVSANGTPAQTNQCYYYSSPGAECATSPAALCAPPTHYGSYGPYGGCFITLSSGAESLAGDIKCCGTIVIPATPDLDDVPLETAIEALPESEKSKPANPAIIADIANEEWRRAASMPGYDGLSYDATNPITAQDVQKWQQANPDAYPTVGDMLAPQAAPSGGTAATPFTLPNAAAPVATVDPSTQPSQGTNPSTQPQENLGPDPGIGFPTLETIPTVAEILDPIFNALPGLKNYVVPSHQAVCPTGTFTAFNQPITLQAQCTLAEDPSFKAVLSAAMFVVWSVVALRIILSA